MRPVVRIFDSGAGQKLIRTDVQDLIRLEDTFKREVLEIWSSSDRRLLVSRANTHHICMSQMGTAAFWGVVEKRTVP